MTSFAINIEGAEYAETIVVEAPNAEAACEKCEAMYPDCPINDVVQLRSAVHDVDAMNDELGQLALDDFDYEDDGQPSEYEEYQDFYGGDDWDHGQYDCYDEY